MRKFIIRILAKIFCVDLNSIGSRYFRHKTGFADDTKFIEIRKGGGVVLHLKNGGTRETVGIYGIKDCVERVRENTWFELFF